MTPIEIQEYHVGGARILGLLRAGDEAALVRAVLDGGLGALHLEALSSVDDGGVRALCAAADAVRGTRRLHLHVAPGPILSQLKESGLAEGENPAANLDVWTTEGPRERQA